MPKQRKLAILSEPDVCAALADAWRDSYPGPTGGHEEGGFILRDFAGKLSVLRWPKGAQDAIDLPPHPNCQIGQQDIVATFHIHPNTGSDYVQEPGETDRRAVRDDPDLKGEAYAGELVISQETVYLVDTNGQVSRLGRTREILGEG
jgi:hypothetical protein